MASDGLLPCSPREGRGGLLSLCLLRMSVSPSFSLSLSAQSQLANSSACLSTYPFMLVSWLHALLNFRLIIKKFTPQHKWL